MNQNDLTIDSERTPRRPDLNVAVGQFTSRTDVDQNIETIDRLTFCAAQQGADLIVFPEASMYAWDVSSDEIAEVASSHGERFIAETRVIARKHGVAMVVGSYVRTTANEKPMNRLTAFDATGSTVSEYDKLHLYDAYSWKESDTVTAGPILGGFRELGTFELRGWRVGMLSCYDLRFPELARGLTELGVDIIAMSSAWVRGSLKQHHLTTLAAARAIETTSFVAVSNQGGTRSTGQSMVLSPFGTVLGSVPLEEGIVNVVISDEVLGHCREELPIRANRRYAATGEALT